MTDTKKNIVWLSGFLLLIAVCAVLIYIYSLSAPVQSEARIISDGKLVRSISLTDVSEPYDLEITAPNGGHNTVHVEKGKIGVIHADCPDKLCQKRGLVGSGAMPVVCVPNKLSIILTGNNGTDAVTGGGF